MTYELAKELKDAGFTQLVDADTYLIEPDSGLVAVPTLSQLIEACGDGFFNLARLSEREWVTNFDEDQNPKGDTQGTTSNEAVARLWLALNRK